MGRMQTVVHFRQQEARGLEIMLRSFVIHACVHACVPVPTLTTPLLGNMLLDLQSQAPPNLLTKLYIVIDHLMIKYTLV